MKFLIDQQLPRILAAWIRAQGHDASHIREIGMEHAEDRAIWREAISCGAVIVSKDEDFSVIVRAESGPQVYGFASAIAATTLCSRASGRHGRACSRNWPPARG